MMSTMLSVGSVFSYIGYIILAILILLLMVLIHELGHYLAGKMLKFKITEFSVGFGPKIFQKKKKNGELISLRALPLGGYCAFEGEGENLEENGENSNPDAFMNQKAWKRLIVLFFGAFFNFLSAFIFSFLFLLVRGDGFVDSLVRCVPFTFELTWQILVIFGQLITGKLGVSSLTGPVGTIKVIADFTQQSATIGFLLLPLIALNLAIFNLFPIPALDGFQMIFTLIEMIRKKPVKQEIINLVNNIGLFVLLGLVVLIDIINFFA